MTEQEKEILQLNARVHWQRRNRQALLQEIEEANVQLILAVAQKEELKKQVNTLQARVNALETALKSKEEPADG